MIYLGKNMTAGGDVELSVEALTATHTRVQGTTGAGKSKFLQLLAQDLIRRRYSFVLVDGKGDLYDTLCRFLIEESVDPSRVVLLDPKDASRKGSRTAGFNPLALGELEPWSRAQLVLDAYKKVFHSEKETKPWLEEYLLHSVVPLAQAGLGILELEQFLGQDVFRREILGRCADPSISEMWQQHQQHSRSERAMRIGAALSRGRLIRSSGEGLRRILGQVEETLDWKRLLDQSGILLVNSNRGSVPGRGSWILGTLVIQKIIETAMARPKNERQPVFLLLDECQEFASSDFVEALTKLRGFGIHLILAHQNLEQLREVPGFYGAVDSCCQNRFIFSVTAEDAGVLGDELFTGFWPDRKILQEIDHTIFAPVQEMELRTSTTRFPGSSSSSRSETRDEDGEEQNTTEAFSESDPYDLTSEREELVTRYEERREVSSRQIETLEDVKDRAKAMLTVQDRRDAIMKVGQRRPLRVRVTDVPEPFVSDSTLEAWKAVILAGYPSGEEIDQAAAARVSSVVVLPESDDPDDIYQPE